MADEASRAIDGNCTMCRGRLVYVHGVDDSVAKYQCLDCGEFSYHETYALEPYQAPGAQGDGLMIEDGDEPQSGPFCKHFGDPSDCSLCKAEQVRFEHVAALIECVEAADLLRRTCDKLDDEYRDGAKRHYDVVRRRLTAIEKGRQVVAKDRTLVPCSTPLGELHLVVLPHVRIYNGGVTGGCLWYGPTLSLVVFIWEYGAWKLLANTELSEVEER